jgi:DNA-binding NarL/FixJ family response regulator
VVDDHADFRGAAQEMLEADGFDVIGQAGTGHDALRESLRLRPDVVLLDIRLPDVDGLTVAEELCALAEPPLVVLVSSREASVYGERLRNTAARGFLGKAELTGEALRRVLTG